jgi:hypothetical protein
MFRKSWNQSSTPVSDNAAFADASATVKESGRYGPTLSELQSTDQSKLPPMKPVSRGWSTYWKIRLVWLAVGGVFWAISANWKVIDKFAPGANKAIHRSIDAQEDLDYHQAKADEAYARFDKATTRSPGQSNAEFRALMATQGQAALNDMREHYTLIKTQALPLEKIPPACQPIVYDVVNARDEWLNAEDAMLKAIRDNSQAEIDAAAPLEDAAISHHKAARAAYDSSQCTHY